MLELYVEEQNWKSLLKNLSMRSDLNFLNMYEKQIPQEFEADIVQVYKEILEKMHSSQQIEMCIKNG